MAKSSSINRRAKVGKEKRNCESADGETVTVRKPPFNNHSAIQFKRIKKTFNLPHGGNLNYLFRGFYAEIERNTKLMAFTYLNSIARQFLCNCRMRIFV